MIKFKILIYTTYSYINLIGKWNIISLFCTSILLNESNNIRWSQQRVKLISYPFFFALVSYLAAFCLLPFAWINCYSFSLLVSKIHFQADKVLFPTKWFDNSKKKFTVNCSCSWFSITTAFLHATSPSILAWSIFSFDSELFSLFKLSLNS